MSLNLRASARAIILDEDGHVLLCRFVFPHPAVPNGAPAVWAEPVRIRIGCETLCCDRGMPAEQRLGDPMHAVEHLTVGGEDDRHGQVCVPDSPCVVDNLAHGGWLPAEPAVLVDLWDRVYRHLVNSDTEGRPPNGLDVPCTVAEGRCVARSALYFHSAIVVTRFTEKQT
jgi:hypothetical protein